MFGNVTKSVSTGVQVSRDVLFGPPAAGMTAEWIVESPGPYTHPLPDFGTVTFQGGAITNEATSQGPYLQANVFPIDADAVLNMVDNDAAGYPIGTMATAEVVAGDTPADSTVQVTWQWADGN